ncbi:MAG: Hsp20/alpha crystallin family protein [Promethearchaeota archaeon]
MAMVEKEKKDAPGDEEGRKEPVYRVYPDIYRHVDYGKKSVEIEVSLPGVKKEDIVLKALPTWFHLEAKRPDDNVIYSANTGFGCEVVPEKTTADYFSGLLKIHAKIKDPMDDAKVIKF